MRLKGAYKAIKSKEESRQRILRERKMDSDRQVKEKEEEEEVQWCLGL